MKKALFVIDVQQDFCPGGTLPVPGGADVIPVINRLMEEFSMVLSSQDWHPEHTVHFKKWPPHCIAGTPGAELHPELKSQYILKRFLTGTGNQDDGYSAFEAMNENLTAYLETMGITDLYVCGLATDYCVLQTVLDALTAGFNVVVIEDGIKGIGVKPGDIEMAIQQMEEAGAKFVMSKELLTDV